ncbi:MAG: ribbon-helix-helix protein, CopG family [Clostridiales bacterium]|nr:ribbon-helix-helix protein, CopG family [Clostridiales bacterium]
MSEDKLVIDQKKYNTNSSVVTVRMPSQMLETVDEISKKTNHTRNDIILKCLDFSLEKVEIR